MRKEVFIINVHDTLVQFSFQTFFLGLHPRLRPPHQTNIWRLRSRLKREGPEGQNRIFALRRSEVRNLSLCRQYQTYQLSVQRVSSGSERHTSLQVAQLSQRDRAAAWVTCGRYVQQISMLFSVFKEHEPERLDL